MGNSKIKSSLRACIKLRNYFEIYFFKEVHSLSLTVNLLSKTQYYLDECQKEYLIKILQKLNNAIIKQENGEITISLTQGQAEILQKFTMLNNQFTPDKWLNKEDIFSYYE